MGGRQADDVDTRSLVGQLRADARAVATVLLRRAEPSAADVRHVCLTQDSYWILALTRVREAARRRGIPVINHLVRRLCTVVFGCEIGNDVTLGTGVTLIHPIGVVIGGDTRVGDRVRIMGANTFGTAAEDGYPTVQDDVTIGAGARILGPVVVGVGAVVGANAVVIEDVAAGSVVVGVPARVVSRTEGWPEAR